MTSARVLLVENDAGKSETVAKILGRAGFNVDRASEGSAAIRLTQQTDYEAALVDLSIPGLSAAETIRRLKKHSPHLEIIVLTECPAIDASLNGFQGRIFDYVCLPAEVHRVVLSARHAIEQSRLAIKNRNLMRQIQSVDATRRRHHGKPRACFEGRLSPSSVLVGNSKSMVEVRRQIAEAAASDMNVLIRGESGTGKDVAALLIHEMSSRRDTGPLAKIYCPSIPESLFESELFGHEAGAFTGAKRRQPGRFEIAVGGTIFLDEIGSVPISIQVKMLQAIEYKQFTRLGDWKTIDIDTRVVAATNEPLERLLANGQFRMDLFYRLNEYPIELPPLRDRVGDIPLLVNHFLQKYHKEELRLSAKTMALLIRHAWPGNVRELEVLMKRFALSKNEDTVMTALQHSYPETREHFASGKMEEVEIQAILAALTETRWNQRQTAQLLGISYSTLRRKIARYDLKNLGAGSLAPLAR